MVSSFDEMVNFNVKEWPTPTLLEGVKSRTRAIFEVSHGEFTDSGIINRISGINLTLGSRIAAIGEAGRVAADLLLSKRTLKPCKMVRHMDLVVAHLGPHIFRNKASADEHEAALVAVLATLKPNVVVLDEALDADDAGWAQTFHTILGCEALRTFRGAVVVCASQELSAIAQVCSLRWASAGEWLWQEDILSNEFEFVEDALGSGKVEDMSLEPILDEVRDLSDEMFNEDSIEKAIEFGWTVSLLFNSSPERRLGGYVCWRLPHQEGSGTFDILRIAVSDKYQGKGLGRWLMRWVLGKAAQLPPSECRWISLYALHKAVPFYERFGFLDMGDGDPDDEDQQTHMEMRNRSME